MGFLIQVVDAAFRVYGWFIIVRIILSFIPHNPHQPIIRFVYEITEPVLKLARGIIPPMGMIDFSPILVFFAIEIVRSVTIKLLISLLGFTF